jgi:hypothetical protein
MSLGLASAALSQEVTPLTNAGLANLNAGPTTTSYGQSPAWSTFIDSTRAVDWSTAGFAVPDYTVPCAVQPTGMMPDTNTPEAANANKLWIEMAIASCDTTHNVVNIPAGRYYVDGFWYKKDFVVVRGAGSLLTTLLIVKSGLCINGPGVCMAPPVNETHGGSLQAALTPPVGSRQCAWTGGLTKGSNPITLSKCGGSPPPVGTIINLDQENDDYDTGGVFVCDSSTYNINACSRQTSSNRKGRAVPADVAGQPTRSNAQTVQVTGLVSNSDGTHTVTLARPVMLSNIRAERKPGVYWLKNATRDGIEDLTIDHSAATSATSPIGLHNCHECWISNVRSIKGGKAHISLWHASSPVVRNNYLFGSKTSGSQSYGILLDITSSALIENNIFHQVTTPIMPGAGVGSVIAYNFNVDNVYGSGSNWNSMMLNSMGHAVTNPFLLWEGNVMNGVNCDASMWGTTGQGTLFRNAFQGWQHDKSNTRVSIALHGPCRGVNVVGNVLGQPGHHAYYESYPTQSGNVQAGVNAGGTLSDKSIYNLGWTGLVGTGSCASGNGPGGDGLPGARCDTGARDTLMRWGNYDTVTGSVRWDADEASPAGVPYINPNFTNAYFARLPQSLPSSLYRTTKPSWWPAAKPWPTIGPDITTGNVGTCTGAYDGSQATSASQCTGGTLTPQWAGHITSNPAMDCYLSIGGTPDGGDVRGGGTPLNFDAKACYSNMAGN